ncbi:hypothetical protein Lfu02_46880 [Longispora fulva]|uniref:Uncharacterized protein n=1 Tax=Longispora fulva TaxID=619741 RepID=A0A8J7GCJ5_9ACTN|nr:hypothetical protein [Longispora fulva]MBG6138063.1 hypothetical protein [Longispora fulva]GIG60316.1 hypothetical protein Lfu02_46880 [Longispora fulva]
MTTSQEPEQPAVESVTDAEAVPEVELTRKERRALGKHPQHVHGQAPTQGKGATLAPRRQYSNRRSG